MWYLNSTVVLDSLVLESSYTFAISNMRAVPRPAPIHMVIHEPRPYAYELVEPRGNTHAEHDIEYLEVQVAVLVPQAQVVRVRNDGRSAALVELDRHGRVLEVFVARH